MDSSNMKYNCPIVLLQDSYLKSFYFQPTPYFHGLWRDGLGKVDFQVGWLLVWVWFFFPLKCWWRKCIHRGNIWQPQYLLLMGVPVSHYSLSLWGRSVSSESFIKMQQQNTDYPGSWRQGCHVCALWILSKKHFHKSQENSDQYFCHSQVQNYGFHSFQ